jgi:small subunit ribosomal protein S16
VVGYYDPCRNPAVVKINHERVKYWLERGAQPSDTVRSLLKRNAEPSAEPIAAPSPEPVAAPSAEGA